MKNISEEVLLIDKINSMCVQSLCPESYDKWLEIRIQLEKTRGIDIEWDRVELLDKLNQSYRCVGVDALGNKYESYGVYEGDSIVRIEDIEIVNGF